MSGKWESLAVAAILSTSLNANAMEENEVQRDENPTKIENITENSSSIIAEDMSEAWQVAPSKEGLISELKEDVMMFNQVMDTLETVAREGMLVARAMEGDPVAMTQIAEDVIAYTTDDNVIEEPDQTNFFSEEQCMYYSLVECMVKQSSNPEYISQKYGATPEEFAQMQEEGKDNIFGTFLEYLSVVGDKELANALGVPEEGLTPKILNAVLASAPELPYEKQEEIYNNAMNDGRVDEFNDAMRSGLAYSPYKESNIMAKEAGLIEPSGPDGATVSLGNFEDVKEINNTLVERYGENAKGLILKAFTCDNELAESFGYKEGEATPQALICMLTYSKELPKETVEKMVTPQDNELADKVFNTIVNEENKGFDFDSNTQKSVSNIPSIIAKINKKELSVPAQKLALDLAQIHPETKTNTNTNTNMYALMMANMQASR